MGAESRFGTTADGGGDSSRRGGVEVASQVSAVGNELDQRWELRMTEIMDNMSSLLRVKSDGRG